MGLDSRTGALEANTLDHVRIKRPLQQPLNSSFVFFALFILFISGGFDLSSILLEYVDKCVPYNLPFLFGVFDVL
jgi:hypothetical protein